VREVGRGSGMEEHSLKIGEVLRGEEGDDGDRKQVYRYFGKRFAKVYVVMLHVVTAYFGQINDNDDDDDDDDVMFG